MSETPDEPRRDEGDGETTHDWNEDRPVSVAVVKAVATHRGMSPTDLPPLFDALDADSLNDLLGSVADRPAGTDRCVVAFDYDGCLVTVDGDGTVSVRDRDPAGEDGDLTVRDPDPVRRDREAPLAEPVDDPEWFEDALGQLIREAEERGVNVGGGWTRRDGGESPDWGIEIVELR